MTTEDRVSKGKRRVAFFGGSFDPVHNGHIEIARKLTALFELDEFVFIPAFHAPHKRSRKPVSPFHRFAMLSLVTAENEKLSVSTIELEAPDKPYSIQTLSRLKGKMPEAEIFFVIGADSWEEITTWRQWERVLTIVNILVVTRPGIEIGFDHLTDQIRQKVVDLRNEPVAASRGDKDEATSSERIFFTDSVNVDISATKIRKMIRQAQREWASMVPAPAVNYIEKYYLYK